MIRVPDSSPAAADLFAGLLLNLATYPLENPLDRGGSLPHFVAWLRAGAALVGHAVWQTLRIKPFLRSKP